MTRKLNFLVCALITLSGISFTTPAALAQGAASIYWQAQIQSAVTMQMQQKMQRQLEKAESAMRTYANTHNQLPNGLSDFDDYLNQLANDSGSDSNTSNAIQTNGKYRMYNGFAIATDNSFVSIPIINGVPKVPDYVSGPPNTIVIQTDGDKHCVGWIAGIDGKPMVFDNGTPSYFEVSLNNN